VEGDVLGTVSLLGCLTLNETFRLKGSEFVLDRWVVLRLVAQLGETDERLLLTTWISALSL
jgi:hypothetical protein